MRKYYRYGSKFNTENFNLAKFDAKEMNLQLGKADGGFWVSSDEYEYPWEEWCKKEMPEWLKKEKHYFALKKAAKILTLDSDEKLLSFIETYKEDSGHVNLTKVIDEYDALEVIYSNISPKLRANCFVTFWDVDSMQIFNPDVIVPID